MFEIWNYLKYENIQKNFKFGFESIEQLNEWFTEKEIKKMKYHGFEIKKYSSNIYFKTEKQLIFSNENYLQYL
jgi:hypothetical protein